MKKVLILFLGLILLPLSTQAIEYKEGTHYQVIKQTATATPEVTEFFSFYCGHCYALEPTMKSLKDNLADGVKLQKNHVDFWGGPLVTNAYAAAKILQVEDKVTALIFERLQKQHKKIKDKADVLAIFEQAGVSTKEAESAMESFPVIGLASKMKRDTEKFAIHGVPTIIVNGKYKVNRASVKSPKEFIALVNYLAQKKD